MSAKAMRNALCLALPLMIAAVATPGTAQVCGPDPDGRVAAVDYRDTVITWEPVVEYERMILTIGGPCEDIVKVFGRGEPIFFDLREIERVGDGVYTWELRREATISSATKKALAESRKNGDDKIWWNLWQQGAIPQGPYVDAESFTVDRGVIVPPDLKEEGGKDVPVASRLGRTTEPGFGSAASHASLDGVQFGFKDQVIPDDLIVQGSTCVGFDCINNTTFDDSTILLRENNTRIKFDDTSAISGFPTNDWEIQANSSNSGGGNFLAINDCGNSSQGGCADDPLFKIEAGARANALYVESDGDVGIGTANPVLDLHIVNGNTPGIRLDQDGSGGFSPQVWDVAGNEASFFIRDVTGGSTLPFRIRPGAPTSSIDIAGDGDVGIGTGSPSNKLHVRSTASATDAGKVLIQNANAGAAAARELLEINNNGNAVFILKDTTIPERWTFTGGSNFLINNQNNPGVELTLDAVGNLTITGIYSPSDRSLKADIVPVGHEELLAKLDALPIATWRFKNDEIRHIGPMSQDFAAAFGLGIDDKTISPNDLAGVSIAAVQALRKKVSEKDDRIVQLEQQNTDLATRLERLEALVFSLTADR